MFRKKSILSAAVALMLTAALFILPSCSAANKINKLDIGTKAAVSDVSGAVRSIDTRAPERALSSEAAELYLDKKTGAVSFYDRQSGKIWNSLPSFENSFASVFSLTVLENNKLSVIDSSGSLAGFSYKTAGNEVDAFYELSLGESRISIPVSFELNSGYLTVKINTKEITVSEGIKIISLSFMPYLGAVRYTSENSGLEALEDYFLVPDGPGAVLRTAMESDVRDITFSVYGKNYYKESIASSVAAFGVKSGEAGLSAAVISGAENALIRVIRSNADENNINRIYPEFIITPVSGEAGNISVCDKSFDGEIAVAYEALSYENADYMGIAVSVRQALVNAGLVPNKAQTGRYPLFITLTGSTDGSSDTSVTSFQQAENILSLLKGKGVNEINMMLEGFFSGGISAKNQGSFRPLSGLGGKKAFSELNSYASSQQLNVFAGLPLMTVRGITGVLRDINNEKREELIYNGLFPYIGDETQTRYFSSLDKMSEQFSDAIDVINEYGCRGIAVLDSKISCEADLSSEEPSYKEYSERLSENLSALRVHGSVMLDGVNMNILRFADFVRNTQLETNIPETADYTAVPFIPAVIHSSCIYAGKASNTHAAPTLWLLKSVEYGAALHYHWTASSESDKYYEQTLGGAVDFYTRALHELGDLSLLRMTDHYEYESGVYCTEYEGGIKVYVNYNNYSVLIGKVSVLPYDYLRIG